MAKKQTLQYGAVVLLCSAVIVKLIGALFKIPLSSEICLGDLGFGYFSSAYDLFTPIYSLAMAGPPIAVSKIVSEYAAQKSYKSVRLMLKISRRVYFIIGAVGFALFLPFVFLFSEIGNIGNDGFLSLVLITPTFLFCCLMSALRGYYEGLGNMYPTAISEVIEALCKLGLGFGLGFAAVKITGNPAYGAAAAIFGITVGTGVATLYLRLYYGKKGDGITESELLNSPKESPDISAKKLVLVAIPVALASLSSNIVLIIDALTVRIQLDGISDILSKNYSSVMSGLSNVGELSTLLYGIRSKAYTVYNIIPTFVTVIGVSAVPVIAMAINGKLKAKSVGSALKLSAIISFPAGIGLAVASSNIMGLLFDSAASVEIGGVLLKIFGISALFSGIAIPLTSVLQALGYEKRALFNIGVGALVKLTVGLITVSNPKINIMGAAVSTLCSYVTILILHLFSLIKRAKVMPDIKNSLLKPLVSAVVCGMGAHLILRLGDSDLITVSAILFAAILYFLCLVLLKTFEKEDFSSLPKGESIIKFCVKHRIIR